MIGRWRRRASNRDGVLLLCFGLDENFLSHKLFPAARRLELGPATQPRALEQALPGERGLVLQCINLTEPQRLLPPDAPLRRLLTRRGLSLANGRLVSHAKRHLHGILRSLDLPCAAAGAAGPPDELLIVKADHNSGALVERSLPDASRAWLGLPQIPAHVPTHNAYPVRPRREIPAAWFHDPFLVVERYLRTDSQPAFRLFVAGRHAQLYVRESSATLVRGGNSQAIAVLPLTDRGQGWPWPAGSELPPAWTAVLDAAWRVGRASGLEVGAIDILTDGDGCPYVIDINTTPYLDSFIDYRQMLAHLRAGLETPHTRPRPRVNAKAKAKSGGSVCLPG